MTFAGTNFNDFPQNRLFQKMLILVHFEDEGTAGTLLVWY